MKHCVCTTTDGRTAWNVLAATASDAASAVIRVYAGSLIQLESRSVESRDDRPRKIVSARVRASAEGERLEVFACEAEVDADAPDGVVIAVFQRTGSNRNPPWAESVVGPPWSTAMRTGSTT